MAIITSYYRDNVMIDTMHFLGHFLAKFSGNSLNFVIKQILFAVTPIFIRLHKTQVHKTSGVQRQMLEIFEIFCSAFIISVDPNIY